jgi:hypothetical protein
LVYRHAVFPHLYPDALKTAFRESQQRAVLVHGPQPSSSYPQEARCDVSIPIPPIFDSGFPHGSDQWISTAGTAWAALAVTLAFD